MWNLFLGFFNVHGIKGESHSLWMHAVHGKLSPAECTFVPFSEHAAVCRKARVWLALFVLPIAASLWYSSPLPVMYTFLPYTLGAWHFVLVGTFQHASLAQDTLDHRLNSRTVYVNPVSAFIYWYTDTQTDT